MKELKRKESKGGKSHHVTGQELLQGLRSYAIEQYGPLAITVLRDWGITKCGHFGDMVFNLIEYGVFSKTENDRREDFAEIFTFDDAFVKPFLPAKRPSAPAPADAAPEAE